MANPTKPLTRINAAEGMGGRPIELRDAITFLHEEDREAFAAEIGASGSSGSAVIYMTAPSGGDPFHDFTMFPDEEAPSTGTYIALTQYKQWVIKGGWTQWRFSDLSSSES